MDGVQVSQGKSHYEKAVYFLPLSSQKWYSFYRARKNERLSQPSGFEHRTTGLGIQHLNYYAIAPWEHYSIMAIAQASLNCNKISLA